MTLPKINTAAALLLVAVLSAVILIYAKPFLVPFTLAGLLSMLLLPVTKWLQAKGVNRVLSIIIAILALVLTIAGVIALIAWQVQDLAKESSGIEQQLNQKVNQLQKYINDTFGISEQKQEEVIKKQQQSQGGGGGGEISKILTGLVSGIGGFLTDTILVFVYIFLFIFFSGRIKNFIIRLAGQGQKANTAKALKNIQQVSQKYITGLAMMIVILWIMYGIGFTIVGIKQPLFFAVLCGLLEIVPFIGNLTGTGITILVSLMQGGDANMIIGIIITYALVQFIQTYLLEPLVVGAGVNINPLFTIIALVAGELLWGIPGMMLAIPLMAMVKIICEHVPDLQPYAYVMGSDEKEGDPKEKLKKFGESIAKFFGKK